MIDCLRIQNFQSHKATELNLDKGMNVIIGQSDNGKTAIIRALRWLIWNRPGGDDFRSYWGGETKVEIDMNKIYVSRSKGAENLYELNKTVFKAFGQDIPDEVKQAMDMSEINIQTQFDSPFLLSETSGNIALHFNKIAKLDRIDIGLQNVNRMIKEISKSIDFCEQSIEEKTQALKAYSNLETIESLLIEAEKTQAKKELIYDNLEKLKSQIEKIERVQLKLSETKDYTGISDKIDKMLELHAKKKQATENYTTIKNLSLSIYYKQQDIIKKEKAVSFESKIDAILNLYTEKQKALISRDKILKECQSIEHCIETLEKSEKALLLMESDYKKNFPNICPLCNTKLK